MTAYRVTFLLHNVFLKLDLETDDEKRLDWAIQQIEVRLGCSFLYKEESEK